MVQSPVSDRLAKRRVFWLGMHKVLKPTELKRLREIGFEVFNPAYLSPVYDQSADLRIDVDQPTTLPRDVFDTLLEYDFFYRPIEQHIADLLNAHFDAVVVTINSTWLKSILDSFKGPVVYRVYGQHFSLSELLVHDGLWEQLMSRSDFTIVPFAAESIESEHLWFRDMCSEPVPYQIPDDVFNQPRWSPTAHNSEIAVSLPNIQNPYFASAYADFAGPHPEKYFRIYGPQRAAPQDDRIIGSLPRQDFLDRLRLSAGYFYDYRDNVAYLPPIEMMEMRGPVLCAAGSLLARFLGDASPNVCFDAEDARDKMRRLVNGDAAFAKLLIDSQEDTRQRYDRAVTGPIFDRVMLDLLSGEQPRAPGIAIDGPVLRSPALQERASTISVGLHADGLFEHVEGRPYAFEGIPRVVDTVVKMVTADSDVSCEVSCTRRSLPVVYDFFIDQFRKGAVSLYVIDAPRGRDDPSALLQRLAWVDAIDARPNVTSALAPHYYLFPELMLGSKRLTLYLPDYFPFLAPNEVFDETPEKDARNKAVGIELARRADRILTNSRFTKAYLPAAGFTDGPEDQKVIVAPLPFLGADRAAALTAVERELVIQRLAGRPFLFYPTANRPNKNLAFLFDVFAELRMTRPELGIVMTCDLKSYAPAARAAERLQLQNDIHLFPRASEGLLRWFYRNTAALCLTSNLEGNFPPQVLEALNYGAPVVATRLPTMTEILGPMADKLLLCTGNDRQDFLGALNRAIDDRRAVLAAQETVTSFLRSWNSAEAFKASLRLVFPESSNVGAA